MKTVYDTSVVAYANGELVGRRAGNVLDRRLRKLEEFIRGVRTAWYNTKLLREYQQKISEHRNDVIEIFLARLGDYGRRASRNTLTRQHHVVARRVRWPTHDQHLLAAALDAGRDATILVTETNLASCRASVRREFGIYVEQV